MSGSSIVLSIWRKAINRSSMLFQKICESSCVHTHRYVRFHMTVVGTFVSYYIDDILYRRNFFTKFIWLYEVTSNITPSLITMTIRMRRHAIDGWFLKCYSSFVLVRSNHGKNAWLFLIRVVSSRSNWLRILMSGLPIIRV